jgi:recombinational DNA repair protein RecR
MEITCTICKHYSRTQEQHERHVVTEEHKKNTAIYENGLEAGLSRSEKLADALKQLTNNVEPCDVCEGSGTIDGDACRSCGGTGEQLQSYGVLIAETIPAARAALKAYEAAK